MMNNAVYMFTCSYLCDSCKGGEQIALLHLIQPFDTLVEKPEAAEAAHQANEKTN